LQQLTGQIYIHFIGIMEESKLNVRDLAKRFEAMSPTKKTAVRKPQTVRSVKRPIK
jgi:hypothetical protein